RPWQTFDPTDKASALSTTHAALNEARTAADRLLPVERALIKAVSQRVPDEPVDDIGPFLDAYANTMRDVYRAYPEDLDVAALLAEALMNRTPWQLWNLSTGQPAEGASTIEAKDVLESAFRNLPGAWDHPGLLHFYIHLMEMSPHPELALRHGDRLNM